MFDFACLENFQVHVLQIRIFFLKLIKKKYLKFYRTQSNEAMTAIKIEI